MEQTRKTKTEGRRPRSWAVGMVLGNDDEPVPADELARQMRDWGSTTWRVKS